MFEVDWIAEYPSVQLTLAPLRVQGRRLSTAVETDVELSGPEPEVEGAADRLADWEGLTEALQADVDPTVRRRSACVRRSLRESVGCGV